MSASARALAARLAVVLVAMAAVTLARRWGGGGEGAVPPPRPEVHSLVAQTAQAAQTAPGPEGYEVAARLVELATDPRVDASSAALGQRALAAHGRKMRPAWLSLRGPAARFVTTVALRAGAPETQRSTATAARKAWTPDAKVWSPDEGSFEQRDALVATPPSTFTFELAIPRGARLTFSMGTVNAMRDATAFVVTAVDASDQAHEVCRHRLAPASARRWTDASCGLEAFAGQTIGLRLSTETVPATADERAAAAKLSAAPRSRRAPDDDAGASKDRPLDVPGVGVAMWGSPTLLARTTPRVPYNVLWIVVDGLRPDVIASLHDEADDAAMLGAPTPPLEAHLPRVPGLMPSIDALARRGVRFTRAYSGGSWTRPGTVSMLAGARSSELGLDTRQWRIAPADAARFYASAPPLLPLVARRAGVSTHAFVNNDFMIGYAPVGVDMGFEQLTDHRYRARDTGEITRDATAWLRTNQGTRFFLFVNYRSPHEPYEPPERLLARIPPPPAVPADRLARLYMAEAAKNDEAIGALAQTLDETGLRDRTIVVVTAGHAETLSSAHAGTSALDRTPIRYHHATSNYEETTRVPLVIVAPGLLPEGRVVEDRVRGTDVAPTITELLGLEPQPRSSGRSLVAMARGRKEADERVVVTEGRATRAIMHGRHRLLVRDGLARTTVHGDRSVTVAEELYDLVDDPGERRDLAPSRPELVAEMRARLEAALENVPAAGSAAATASEAEGGKPAVIRLRFAGGARPRRVSGAITVGDGENKARSFTIEPVDVGRDALTISGDRASLAFTTSAGVPVGFDVVVEPPTTPVRWDLYLDDQAWPVDAVFGGPYGLLAPPLRAGVATDDARRLAEASALPSIDPRREVGVFVARDRRRSSAK